MTTQAVPGTTVPIGAQIGPAGAFGPQGATGPTGAIGPGGLPTGGIVDFAGGTAPSGFLLCDGSAVSRTTYSALFGVISTTFGTGDGSTTFNVPDLRSKIAVGAGQGTGLTNRVLAATGGEENHALAVGELAAHNHTIDPHNHGINDPQHLHTSCYAGSNVRNDAAQTTVMAVASGSYCFNTNSVGTGVTTQNATANCENTGSGTGHNTMPPFIVLNKIIKT